MERSQTVAATSRRLWNGLRFLIVFYVVYLGTILPLAWVEPKKLPVALLIVSLIDIPIILVFWRLSRISLRWLLRPPRLRWERMAFWSLVLLALLLVNVSYHAVLTSLLGITPKSETMDGGSVLLSLITICILPALSEEVAFRGIIQEKLQSLFDPREAMFAQAVLFAFIHRSVIAIPYLCALGWFLGWVRQESRSLYPGMIFHFLHNLAIFLYESLIRSA